jgi:DNA-binding FadR family transcriptional regulator
MHTDRRTHPAGGQVSEARADVLALAVATAILTGTFPEGSMLPSEAQLCEQYGHSRTLLREAIRRLSASGMIEKRQGVGTYVTLRRNWNMFDPLVLAAYTESQQLPSLITELIDLRRLIEVEAAGLAAQRIRDSQLVELRQWVDRMSYTLEQPDQYASADMAFHNVILEAAQNRFLSGIERYLADVLLTARRMTAKSGGADRLQRAQTDHEQIFQALGSRDVAQARQAMADHIRHTEEDMRQLLLQVT